MGIKIQISGKISGGGEIREFTGANGNHFRAQEILITDDSDPKYPDTYPVTFWNDRVKVPLPAIGTPVEANAYLKTRKTKTGRWFVSLSGDSLEVVQAAPGPDPTLEDNFDPFGDDQVSCGEAPF